MLPESGSLPIFISQPVDAAKFTNVVSNQREIVGESDRTNQNIIGADRSSFCSQLGANLIPISSMNATDLGRGAPPCAPTNYPSVA